MRKLLLSLLIVLFSGVLFGQSTYRVDLVVRKTTPMFHLYGLGAYINFNNGDLLLTQSSNLLTLSGGDFSLGANNLFTTGSIGTTSSRVLKGWFINGEFTNYPTVAGTAINSIFAPLTSPTFSGTVGGITATMVGLGSVTNESKSSILTSSVLTGTPTAPTATVGTNTTQLATTAFVLANAGGSGSMTWPSAAGIAVYGGSTWSTSITDNSTNWNTAYTDRLKWDGGSTGLTAATGRTSLGATTVGTNLFTLTNPSAITYLRLNADNTVSALSLTNFKTALTLTATDVGLGNVTNESKATMLTSPAITGTPTGITKTHVGLGNVTNESKATMFTNAILTGTLIYPTPFTLGAVLVTTTGTQFNYLNTATSNIQTQLDNTLDITTVAMMKHPTISAKVDSYVLVIADDGTLITMSKGTATTLTVPLNSVEAFPIGSQITILCIGAGKTTVVATSGVTIYSKGSLLGITILGDATLIKIATNSWKLIGSLE